MNTPMLKACMLSSKQASRNQPKTIMMLNVFNVCMQDNLFCVWYLQPKTVPHPQGNFNTFMLKQFFAETYQLQSHVDNHHPHNVVCKGERADFHTSHSSQCTKWKPEQGRLPSPEVATQTSCPCQNMTSTRGTQHWHRFMQTNAMCTKLDKEIPFSKDSRFLKRTDAETLKGEKQIRRMRVVSGKHELRGNQNYVQSQQGGALFLLLLKHHNHMGACELLYYDRDYRAREHQVQTNKKAILNS